MISERPPELGKQVAPEPLNAMQSAPDRILLESVDGVVRRVRVRHLLASYWKIAILCDIAIAALSALFPMRAATTDSIPELALGFVVIPILAALVSTAISTVHPAWVARRMDASLGLEDRVSTALELTRNHSASPFTSLSIADAVNHVRLKSKLRVIDLRLDATLAAVMLLVSLVLTTWHAPNVISSVIMHARHGNGSDSIFEQREWVRGTPAPGEKIPTRPLQPGEHPPAAARTPAPAQPQNPQAAPKTQPPAKPQAASKPAGSKAGSGANASKPGSGSTNPSSNSHGASGSGSKQPGAGGGNSGEGKGSGQAPQSNGSTGQNPQTSKNGHGGSSGSKSGSGTKNGTSKEGNGHSGSGAKPGADGSKTGSGSHGASENGTHQGAGQKQEAGSSGQGKNHSQSGSQGQQGRQGENGNGSGQHGSNLGSGTSQSGGGRSPQSGGPYGPKTGEQPVSKAYHAPNSAPVKSPGAPPKFSYRLPKPSGPLTVTGEHAGNAKPSVHPGVSQVPSGNHAASESYSAPVAQTENNPQIPAAYRSLVRRYFEGTGGKSGK